jgi:hypothetical protein
VSLQVMLDTPLGNVSVAPQIFPGEAHAIIYRPARSATTSGRARTRVWKLRFERRSSPFIEPIMGWTGGDDTLTQVELTFPSAESAVAYAQRQGLSYTLYGRPDLGLGSEQGSRRQLSKAVKSSREERNPDARLQNVVDALVAIAVDRRRRTRASEIGRTAA